MITTSSLPAMAAAVRFPLASNGTMLSESPWITRVGTVMRVKSSRKSVVANAAVESSVPFGEATSAMSRL